MTSYKNSWTYPVVTSHQKGSNPKMPEFSLIEARRLSALRRCHELSSSISWQVVIGQIPSYNCGFEL